jgi:hypothetical protein
MSADYWTICPKCNTRNPDAGPDSEYQGTMSMECNVHYAKPEFRIIVYCYNCDYEHTFTQNDLP